MRNHSDLTTGGLRGTLGAGRRLGGLLLATCLLAVCLLGACGGSGGSLVAPLPTDLGTFASTQPTVVPIEFTNPLAEAATVTRAASAGAFSVAPGSLGENPGDEVQMIPAGLEPRVAAGVYVLDASAQELERKIGIGGELNEEGPLRW